jgi:arylformamidase
MGWIDVTLALSENVPPWPGDPPFNRQPASNMSAGDKCNTSRIEMSSHFGTHLDAPFHFLSGGQTVDNLDPDILIGPCSLIEHKPDRHIEPRDIEDKMPEGRKRVLIKTRNSNIIHDSTFHEDFLALTEDAAKWLTDAGVRLVGLDYFSIAPYKQGTPIHRPFLGAGGIAIEGLDLSDVSEGEYFLVAMPLKIKDGDGGPCRVMLHTLPFNVTA